jgi:DNA repair exonuclease SbcCD nuclease subunit
MKQLYVLGDLHLNLRHEWSKKSFDLFFNWFDNLDLNCEKQDAELLLLGDVTDQAQIPGGVVSLLTNFYQIAEKKFARIYTLGGNHCQKLINDTVQHTTQFLEDRPNHTLIFKESIFVTDNGFEIVALPYQRCVTDDYYSNELPSEFYEEHDILVGHVAIKEPKTFYGGIDISKFNCKRFAFGHIHSRQGLHAEKYTGSIMPFRVDEQDELAKLTRCMKVFSLDGTMDREITIPPFCKYVNIKYGEERPPEYVKTIEDTVYICTITDCDKKLQVVKDEYSDYNIRAVVKPVTESNNNDGKQSIVNNTFITPEEALDSWTKENNVILNRKTKVFLKNCLNGVYT